MVDLIAAPSKDQCILWPWGKNDAGYGVVWNGRENVRAHRFAYEAAGNLLGAEQVLRHDCDTPACINPLHLTPGTTADNVADRVKRKRGIAGERHPRAKVTVAQVAEIRASLLSHKEVAPLYGITSAMVGYIRRGQSWKDCL